MKKALILLFLTGCSSIVEGRSQEIQVVTNPPAKCTFTRNGEMLGTIETPASLYIEKSKYDITITCKKSGYQTANYLDHSGVAGATLGNVLLGGGVGFLVDSATGADNKYETPVNLTLTK